MTSTQNHFLRSSHREALIEHLFAGEVMKCLWPREDRRLEILKPQVDDGGYDLVLEANGVVRHVQLQASYRGSTVSKTSVNVHLATKPSGCVVFVRFDDKTTELGPFWFFGRAPGEPLPDLGAMKTARHTKANAQGIKTARPNIREVPSRGSSVVKTFHAWSRSCLAIDRWPQLVPAVSRICDASTRSSIAWRSGAEDRGD